MTEEARPIVELAAWEIIPMADVENQSVQDRVLASVEKVGILYPLIILRTTRTAWEKEKATTNPDILDPPDYLFDILRIQCGCNRYRAGLELGYTTFNCIVVDDLEEAKRLSVKQRKETKGW